MLTSIDDSVVELYNRVSQSESSFIHVKQYILQDNPPNGPEAMLSSLESLFDFIITKHDNTLYTEIFQYTQEYINNIIV